MGLVGPTGGRAARSGGKGKGKGQGRATGRTATKNVGGGWHAKERAEGGRERAGRGQQRAQAARRWSRRVAADSTRCVVRRRE